jgi:uncharacterized repeat protein (TIGR03803 family)
VVFGLLLATSQAQTNYQRILSFGPLPQSGSSPRGQLMEGSDGWLYGTTYAGGTNGSGTVFKIGKTGVGFARLHSFADGDFPCGGLVEANDGTLCGTTSSGGAYHSGTLFKLNKDGSEFTLLHVFPSSTDDGAQPVASLTTGKGGVLYGTTFGGGAANSGTVFSLNPDGSSYTNLHNFTGTNGADGSFPFASLCQGLDDALYGTTQAGGSNDLGAVFKLNPDGTGYAILHHFSGGTVDGRLPLGGLVQGSDGLLYGTTYYGGTNDLGTVFKLGTNGGVYAVLRNFMGGSQGNQPFAGLVQGVDGVLYGTTRYGGSNDGGMVFKLSTDGSGYTALHNFSGMGGDGSQPLAALLLGTDDALYGSTYWGGDYTTNGVSGTLFRLFSSYPQIVITSITPASGGFLLSFVGGAAGRAYQIQATTNQSVAWQTIGSSTAAIDGTFQFLDSTVSNIPSRFYRSLCN